MEERAFLANADDASSGVPVSSVRHTFEGNEAVISLARISSSALRVTLTSVVLKSRFVGHFFDDYHDIQQVINAINEDLQLSWQDTTKEKLILVVGGARTVLEKKAVNEVSWLRHHCEELQLKMQALEARIGAIENRQWAVTRCNEALDKLAKIQLHQEKQVFEQQLPRTAPLHTKAIIVAVICDFGNHPQGHAYLTFNMHQKGNGDPTGTASLVERHYDWYANIDYHEVILPWSTELPDVLVVDVLSSYNTGSYPSHGNMNFYQLKLVGWISM